MTTDEQAALDTYKSEVSTFAVQRLLGTKSFVKKLITTEPTTAEKLIGKIRELAASLKNKKSPDAKAQTELLKKAESLFMKALSEAGGTIDADGKIHLAGRDDEDAEATENGDVVLDGAGEVRYNKGGTYVQWKSDAMAWANKHDTEIGDRGLGSDGDYYYFYEAIDPYEKGRASDYKVIARVSIQNDALATKLRNEMEEYNAQRRKGVHTSVVEYRSARRNDRRYPTTSVGELPSHGRPGGLDRGKSASVRKRGYQKSDRPVSFHFDKDGREHITEALVKRLCEEVIKGNGGNFESIYSDIGRYRNIPKNHRSNNGDVDGKVRSHGRSGGLDRGKSASVGKRGYQKSDRPVSFHFDDDGTEHITYASGRTEIKRSRKATGKVVTLSKGELAKLHANYAGDKVFNKGAVVEAVKREPMCIPIKGKFTPLKL